MHARSLKHGMRFFSALQADWRCDVMLCLCEGWSAALVETVAAVIVDKLQAACQTLPSAWFRLHWKEEHNNNNNNNTTHNKEEKQQEVEVKADVQTDD